MRYITDTAAVALAQRVGLTLTQLQQAAADAGLVWRYVAANEWIDEPSLRTWCAGMGLDPDRVNIAVRILQASNRLFAFEDTPISPPPAQDSTAPYLAAATANADAVVLVYSESLDPLSAPAKGDFTVTVNNASAAISSLALSGSVVVLTLADAVAPSDIVTVSYTLGSHPLRDYTANVVVELTDAPVANHTPLESLSDDALRERARTLGVEGRSNMNKAELAQAIREVSGAARVE